METTKLHIDIETYCDLNLKKVGVYRYCEHPSFEILLIAYSYDDGPVEILDLSVMGAAQSYVYNELLDSIINPKVVKYAHNALFERVAFSYWLGGENLEPESWFCTMVHAAYCGLPLALGQVSEVLKLGDSAKDKAGRELIKYFCLPCKPTAANGGRTRNLRHHAPDKWEAFKEYCKQDVVAEKAICHRLRNYPIPQSELDLYALDQRINDRGVMVDLDFAKNCFDFSERLKGQYKQQLKDLTGLDNPGSPQQLKRWLESKTGKEIKSLDKRVLPELLQDVDAPEVVQVLKIRSLSAKTSVSKFKKALGVTNADSRFRGLLQFYGAGRTGRWAGRQIQVHNLPRGTQRFNDLNVCRNLVAAREYSVLELIYDEPMSILSGLIRPMFIAPKGKKLVVSDFSAIEARVLAWLAGEKWRLDVFNSHGKIYEASASAMFGVTMENVTKDLRSKGKVSELAFQYQGNIGAALKFGADKMGLSESEIDAIVKKWRKANPAIVQMWYDTQKAAILAVKNPGERITIKRKKGIAFEYDGNILKIWLPSGRHLSYVQPRLMQGEYGDKLTYMGLNSKEEGKGGSWSRLGTYGGKLVENVTQAVARDLLAYSMQMAEAAGFKICMHVHDEIVTEVDATEQHTALDLLNAEMAKRPQWAEGLPLNAEGFVTDFYRKD